VTKTVKSTSLKLIGLTTREGSEQRESLERRIAAGNVRLCGNNTGRDTAR
jgi:hypothetical protein